MACTNWKKMSRMQCRELLQSSQQHWLKTQSKQKQTTKVWYFNQKIQSYSIKKKTFGFWTLICWCDALIHRGGSACRRYSVVSARKLLCGAHAARKWPFRLKSNHLNVIALLFNHISKENNYETVVSSDTDCFSFLKAL